MSAISTTTALILAGGQSRRMGGLAKGRVPLREKALIAHVLDRLAPQVPEVMISANGSEYDDIGLHVVADLFHDDIGGRAGPLAGLHAGLVACESQWLVTAPCDTPFLPLDLVERMVAARSACHQSRLFVAESPRGLEPGFLLCHVGLADELGAWLAAGGRKAKAWLAENSAQAVEFPEAHCFANINTPEDLANYAATAFSDRYK